MVLYTQLFEVDGTFRGDTVLELWGGSTKHPDSVFHYSDFHRSPLCEENHPFQIYQWVLQCASQLSFPPHALKLVTQITALLHDYIVAADGNEKGWEILTHV